MVCSESCPGNPIFIHAVYDTFYVSPSSIKGQIKEIEPIKVEQTKSDQGYIAKTCREYGIDHKLVRAIIQVESRGQADLIGDNGESYGLCQIQPKWHAHRLKDGEDLLDPEVNIRVACEYLTELMSKYDTLDSVLTAYNRGYDDGDRTYANKIYEEMEKFSD